MAVRCEAATVAVLLRRPDVQRLEARVETHAVADAFAQAPLIHLSLLRIVAERSE